MNEKLAFLCASHFGPKNVTVQEVRTFADSVGLTFYDSTPLAKSARVSRGVYRFSGISEETSLPKSLPKTESDADIEARLTSRFSTLEKLTRASAAGIIRSMIVYGPGGLGKTYTIEEVLKDVPEERVSYLGGRVSPTGLYRALYDNRFSSNILVLDDVEVFDNDTSLNMLKKACDSSETRRVSWMSSRPIVDEDGVDLPSTFEFEGTVIFITNVDFIGEVARKSKLAPHLEAMLSRSHYLDLSIKSKRDYIVRIKMVIRDGMLSNMTENDRNEVVDFIETNMNRMNELSLRMALKLSDLKRIDPQGWKEMAAVTCMR